MPHQEDREFQITLHLSATFPDDYVGDDDGFAWFERWDKELRPRLVRALFDAVRADPRFAAVAAPRGRDPESALDIELAFLTGPPSKPTD
jgi:hypothetical protein